MKRFWGISAFTAIAFALPALGDQPAVMDFFLPSATHGSLIRLADYVVLINWWLNDQGEFMREVRPHGQGETPGNYLVSRRGELTYLGLDRGDAAWQKLEEAVTRALAEPAPPLALPDLQARAVKLASFAGKPVVFNFFNASTCDWAGAVFAKLQSDYAGRGLQVAGVDLFDDDAQLKTCTAKYNVRYPVLRGDQATQMAWIGDNKAWATFFVTPDGRVFKKIIDSIDNGLEGPVFSKYAEYLVSKH